MNNRQNRHIKGRDRLLKPRKRPKEKNSGRPRYLTVENRSEIRNSLQKCQTTKEKRDMRKMFREKFTISNSAITQIISLKYGTTENDNIRIGAGMNSDMHRPFVHNENHLILDQKMLEWIGMQKEDPLLKQLPISRSQIIARAIQFDRELNLGVFQASSTNNNDESSTFDQDDEDYMDIEELSDISDDSSCISELLDSELENDSVDDPDEDNQDDISSDNDSLREEIDLDIDRIDDGSLDVEHVTWFMNFIYRYRLARKVAHGEAASCPSGPQLDEALEKIRNILREYPEDDIYNMDEKGLFYAQLPKVTYVFLDDEDDNNSRGSKLMTAKDRVTLVTCCNATGSHKVAPAIIGKAQRPRCFPKHGRLPLPYWGQRKAWMDGRGMTKWLTEVFLPSINNKEKVALLIDNAPPHSVPAVSDKIRIIPLPANSTAKHQPLDQGIIYAFDRRPGFV